VKSNQSTIPTSIPVILVVPTEVPIVPADPLVAPAVGAVSVILPTGVLDLVDNESDPTKQRPERHESLAIHDAMVSRWREKVASRPSSFRDHHLLAVVPSTEFPVAPVVSPPEIHERPAILVQPDKAIPFGQPYRTHPNGPYSNLDSSSSSLSLCSSSDTSLGSPSVSLANTSSVHSSGCDTPGQTRSGPSTRVASPSLASF
nr:hypothetical protein [Tanacetum cinerariifolium]